MAAKLFKQLQKHFFSDEEMGKVTFNWLMPVTFSFFWMYGIFGFFTNPTFGGTVNTAITLLLTGIFFYLFWVLKKEKKSKHSAYNDTYTFSYRDVSVVFLYGVIMLALSFREFQIPMSGDNFYHAQQSQVYGIHLIQLLANHTHALDDYSFKVVLWGINIITVVGIFLLYSFLKRFAFSVQAIFLTTAFVLLRTVMYVSGGNASPFPTLRLLPLWVTSTLFGVSDIAFRLASFVPLLALMVIVYMYGKSKLGELGAFLLGVVAGTIPVVWHTGLLVEFSIWTVLLFTFIMFFLLKKEELTTSYIRPLAVIGISTLMRVSGFVALIPLFAHYLLSKSRSVQDVISYIVYSLPVALLIAPVIIGNFLTGTSATYQGEGYPSLGIVMHASLVDRLHVLISGGYFYAIQYNSFHVPLLVILVLLPLFIVTRKYVFVPVVFYIGICFLLFFSIRPILWGNGRYQAESVAPLIILSLFCCMLWLHKFTLNQSVKKLLLFGVLVCCAVYNVYEFKYIPFYNRPLFGESDYFAKAKEKGEYFVLSEFPYDYRSALLSAKKAGHATSTYYIPGSGYSYFSKILSGYSVEEMRHETRLRDSIGFEFSPETFSGTLEKIKNSKDVSIILLNTAANSPDFYPEKIRTTIGSLGFKEWRQYKEPIYGNVILGYIRK